MYFTILVLIFASMLAELFFAKFKEFKFRPLCVFLTGFVLGTVGFIVLPNGFIAALCVVVGFGMGKYLFSPLFNIHP